MTGPQVTWWAWVVVFVVSALDLAIQGHDLSALRFVLGLLTVNGLVFACTIWPRVIASQDDMIVHNPFRTFVIPWLAVRQVMVADSVQVRCARRSPRKDKTVYSWALSSPRRANARTEMRARQWERTGRGRNRPPGWDRMPESAKEIAKMGPADLIARELASIARLVKAEAVGATVAAPGTAGGSGGSSPQGSTAGGSGPSGDAVSPQASTAADSQAQITGMDGAVGTAGSDGALVPVVSGYWAWQPIVAILVPAAAFTLAMLIK